MSGRVGRALDRLTSPGAILALDKSGRGYGIFPNADRRRRPLVRLSATDVRELEAEGAIASAGEAVFSITDAGARSRAKSRRAARRSVRGAAPGAHRPQRDGQ